MEFVCLMVGWLVTIVSVAHVMVILLWIMWTRIR